MTGHSEFVGFVAESLRPLGPVGTRRMFGGHGIFLDGLMFGLVADGQLYLKADDGNRAAYDAQGLPPFSYRAKDRLVETSYRAAPSEGFDDPEILCDWAREAFAAARRAEARRTGRSRGRQRPASGSAKATT